jgi:hypothetical protein
MLSFHLYTNLHSKIGHGGRKRLPAYVGPPSDVIFKRLKAGIVRQEMQVGIDAGNNSGILSPGVLLQISQRLGLYTKFTPKFFNIKEIF